MGYSRKNPKSGGEVEDTEFPRVLKKYHVEITGVNWKRSRIWRGDQEKIMLNFHESWFLEFQMGETQLYRIFRVKALLCP